MTAPPRSTNAPVIIVGAARSGTNLLRDIVCGFDGYSTWPCDEINYIWRHGNRAESTDELTVTHARAEVVGHVHRAFDRQRARAGGDIVVEKTCATTLRVAFAHRIFPDARFVVIVRDGRDVAASAMRRWTAALDIGYLARKARFVPPTDVPYYAWRYLRSRVVRLGNDDRRLGSWGPRFAGLDEALTEMPLAAVCALQWARCVDRANHQLSDVVDPVAIHRLTYERLVLSPAEEVARLADFLGSVSSEQWRLPVIDPTGVGQWRQALNASDHLAVEAVAGPVLARFGYTSKSRP